MRQKFYLPAFEKQLDGTVLGSTNCGAASTAMFIDQASLGAQDPEPAQVRRETKDREGGLLISQLGAVCARRHIPHTVYDPTDGLTFDELLKLLQRGRFMVVAGDYDVVPNRLDGATFEGFHAEFWHQATRDGDIRVGDPLNDGRRPDVPRGYVWYPRHVAKRYVEKFPGEGINALVMDLRLLRVRKSIVPGAIIRKQPERQAEKVGLIVPGQNVVWGDRVEGQSVAGNPTWFRVWDAQHGKVGFVHSSVVYTV